MGDTVNLYTDRNCIETYKGETYRLIRREIQTFSTARGYRVVWIYVVLSGPAEGMDGGKHSTKAEARKWARHTIRYWAEEAALV
jgi:hypothetical protein